MPSARFNTLEYVTIYDKNECNLYIIIRRNPSGGSGLSETGSLDRAKAALERRKKAEDGAGNPILCRVEVTRPNPDSLIDELFKVFLRLQSR